MKLAICIPTFDRVTDLHRCLASVYSNEEVDCGKVDVFLYPDLITECEWAEQCRVMQWFGHERSWLWTPSPERIYGCRNQYRAVRETFENAEQYTHVIRLDSDLIVSRNYVKSMVKACLQIEGPVISSITCNLPYRQKKHQANRICRGSISGCNIIWDRKSWETCWPMMREFESIFMLDRGNRHVGTQRHEEAKEWLKERALRAVPNAFNRKDLLRFIQGTAGAVGDSVQCCAIACSGVPHGSLVVNRAIHPSPHGENTDPVFHAETYARVSLDDVDFDRSSDPYTWID